MEGNELKAGVCINYISIAVRLSTAFFLTPFVIAKLGAEEYGLFMLSNSVIAWLTLTDFGLGATVNKYITSFRARRKDEEQSYFLGQVIVLYSVLGLIALGVGFACYCQLESLFPNLQEAQYETLKIIFLLTLSNVVLSIPLRPLGSIPWAYMKFIVPGVINLGGSLLNMTLTVILLLMGYKAIGLTVLGVAIGVLSLLLGAIYVFKYLDVKVLFRRPDMALYRAMFRFSFWVFLGQMMDLFYWQAGTPVVARLCGAAYVPLFTLGVSFANYFMMASTAIANVVAPKLMQMVSVEASGSELTRVLIRAGRMQFVLIALMMLGFIVFGSQFLKLWVGASIGEGVSTVWLGAVIVLLPLVLPLTQSVGIGILQAMCIHKGRSIILFFTSLTCVVMGYLLTLCWGAIGMFIGTGVSLFFGQGIAMNLYYHYRARLDMVRFFRETYWPAIMPVVTLLVMGLAVVRIFPADSWSSFAVLASLYGLVCACTLFLCYLRDDERGMILKPLRHLFRI